MKKRRMNNIFKKDGKSFVLAMDHSAQMYSPDLKDPGHIIRECVAGGVDCFLTTYGIIKNFSDDFGNAGIMMRADGGASMILADRMKDCFDTRGIKVAIHAIYDHFVRRENVSDLLADCSLRGEDLAASARALLEKNDK